MGCRVPTRTHSLNGHSLTSFATFLTTASQCLRPTGQLQRIVTTQQ
jgi:hypothetical protein